jgi:hypothetical protein
MICCGYGCVICLRSFLFRLPFCTYPTSIRTRPTRNRIPLRLSKSRMPVAARGKARKKSNSPRKNVRRGFQEDFGVGTWIDKAGGKRSVAGSLKPVSLLSARSQSNTLVHFRLSLSPSGVVQPLGPTKTHSWYGWTWTRWTGARTAARILFIEQGTNEWEVRGVFYELRVCWQECGHMSREIAFK